MDLPKDNALREGVVVAVIILCNARKLNQSVQRVLTDLGFPKSDIEFYLELYKEEIK